MNKEINWEQVKKKYPNMKPYSDNDFDGLVNSRDCRPLDPSRDGIFGRFLGKITKDKYGQTAEEYKKESAEKFEKKMEKDLKKAKAKEEKEKLLEAYRKTKKGAMRALQKKYTKDVLKGYKTRAVKKYTTGKIKVTPLHKKIEALIKRRKESMISRYKRSLRPIRRRPMPPQLRRALEKRKAVISPQQPQIQQQPIQRYPTSIREAQGIRNLRPLLTPQEQQTVDGIFSGSQRAAAMQMIRRRIKTMQTYRERVSPQTIVKRDIMTGRDRVETGTPRERWIS